MLIKYTGAMTIRTVGEITWTRQARVQEVTDPLLIADLLTTRGFIVAPEEPLTAVVGGALPELALRGVTTLPSLAQLTSKEIKELAESLGAAHSDVKEWVATARALTKTQPAAAEELSGALLEPTTLTAVPTEEEAVTPPEDDGG